MTRQVVRHYGHLDPYYRAIWGEHIHHGLWERGDETSSQATEAMVHRVAECAGLRRGPTPKGQAESTSSTGSEERTRTASSASEAHERRGSVDERRRWRRPRVCDIGSGYGATARLLAREYGVDVTAVTLSPEQHAWARSRSSGDPGTGDPGGVVRYLLADWLSNRLPDASFDVALAVECLTHMPDVPTALGQVRRILRPGGTFVACVWLRRDRASALERRWLLDPICEEGRLARLPTAQDVVRHLAGAGLVPESTEDLSEAVRKTWSVCIGRALKLTLSDPAARRFVLDRTQTERIFARTMFRLWAAYRTGSLRYGMFVATRA